MSGTIPLSLTQQFDKFGQPLIGGQMFLIQAGTVSTPQNGFQDSALTLVLPNPITLDAAGRIPQIFLADGFIKVRLTDRLGVTQLAADGIQVVGPSVGGGGAPAVDPNALVQMGNVISRYGVGALAGYVRLNGNTIGSATSGATERANADTQALFDYLWNIDTALVTTPPRGASSAADWAANKQLALPDARGRLLMALPDMGAANNGSLAGVTSFTKGSATALGSLFGLIKRVITGGELPAHTHAVVLTDPGHAHTSNAVANNGTAIIGAANFAQPTYGIGATINTAGSNITISDGSGGANKVSVTGASAPYEVVNPAMSITVYIKL